MQKISQKGNPWRFKTVSSNTVVKKEKEEKAGKKFFDYSENRKHEQKDIAFGFKELESDDIIQQTKEFDPGSGRTLAARLTHASRTELF